MISDNCKLRITMLFKLMLIAALCAATIEATNRYEQLEPITSGINYGLSKWEKDVRDLYAESTRRNTFTSWILAKLYRMQSIENPATFKKFDLFSRGETTRYYFLIAKDIVERTTLLRKSKFITANLIDFLSNNFGCSEKEISSLDMMVDLFGPQSRIEMAMQNIKARTISYCWDGHKDLLIRAINLVGHDIYNAIDILYEYVNTSKLSDYVTKQNYAKAGSLESVAKSLVTYYYQLNNPLIDNFDSTTSSETEAVLREIYENEVLYPSTIFCSLLNPIRRHLDRIRLMTHPGEKYIKHKLARNERLVDMSCDLATVRFDSIKSRLSHQFLYKRLNQKLAN